MVTVVLRPARHVAAWLIWHTARVSILDERPAGTRR